MIPTFYWSMSVEEIDDLRDAANAGGKKDRALRALTGDTREFDPHLVYRGTGVDPDHEADKGPVLLPKLFRRVVAHYVLKKSGLIRGGFPAYLSSLSASNQVIRLHEYVKQGKEAQTVGLDEFMEGSVLTASPLELVFKEKFSSLVDPQGRRIVDWF